MQEAVLCSKLMQFPPMHNDPVLDEVMDICRLKDKDVVKPSHLHAWTAVLQKQGMGSQATLEAGPE